MPSAILGTVDAVMTITGKVHTLKSSHPNTATDTGKGTLPLKGRDG